MKILVTGAGGILGTAIRNAVKPDDLQLIYKVREELDITCQEAVDACLKEERPDVIINCAAYTAVEAAETDPESAYLVNAAGPENLGQAARQTDTWLIHISTDAVFDGTKNGAYTETDVCHPLSAYSKSKHEGEMKLQACADRCMIIRTAWLYAPGHKCFLTTILERAQTQKKLQVVYDQIGSPTYAGDLAAALMAIVQQRQLLPAKGVDIYHYTNEGAVSWFDFAQAILMLSGSAVPIDPVLSATFPSSVSRPFHTVLSKEKIKETFGLHIPYWRTSLERCLKPGATAVKPFL